MAFRIEEGSFASCFPHHTPHPKYPYQVDACLTKTELLDRINHVFEYVDLGASFYGIENWIEAEEINSPKWKTYIYLRKCVVEYKDGFEDELECVLQFLRNGKNKTWLAKRLMDSNVKEQDEKWGTSQHEWIERSLIVDVLKRSAGMVEGVEPETEMIYFDDYDWLFLQAIIRSPNKYIFFKDEDYSLKSGHVGAIKADLNGRGFITKGSPDFHKQLKQAFLQSTTIVGCLKRIRNIFKEVLISGKKHILPDVKKRFLVDGTLTSDEEGVNGFRVSRLRPKGYDRFNKLLFGIIDLVLLVEEKTDIEEVESVRSESSEDER